MLQYKNMGGDSSVIAYDIYDDSIIVQFNTGVKYLYTYQSAGIEHIEKMKLFAEQGQGLNSYIRLYATDKYESILR